MTVKTMGCVGCDGGGDYRPRPDVTGHDDRDDDDSGDDYLNDDAAVDDGGDGDDDVSEQVDDGECEDVFMPLSNHLWVCISASDPLWVCITASDPLWVCMSASDPINDRSRKLD